MKSWKRTRQAVSRALTMTVMITALVGVAGMSPASANTLADANDTAGTLDIKSASVTFDATNATFSVETYESFAATDGVIEFLVDLDGDGFTNRNILFGVTGSDTEAVLSHNWPRGSLVSATHTGAHLDVVVSRALLDNASSATINVISLSPQGFDGVPDQESVFLAPVDRISGSDRIATSIESCFQFDGTADSIVLARSDGFADALAGGPLAAAKNGCLLLTPTGSLDPRVLTEMQRVLPSGSTVYLLGGEAALDPAVANAVTGAGYQAVRLGGDTRFATALKVATDGLGSPGTIFLATGTNFPDALGAAPAAAKRNAAILLSNGSTLTDDVAAFFQSHPSDTVFAIGGPAAAAMPSATAIVGANRYDTAAKLATTFFDHPPDVGVASGVNFPDALAGGASMGSIGQPMLLTDPNALSPEVSSYLQNVAPGDAYLFGGTGAVSEAVAQQLSDVIVAH